MSNMKPVKLANGDTTSKSALIRRVLKDYPNASYKKIREEIWQKYDQRISNSLISIVIMDLKKSKFDLTSKNVYEENQNGKLDKRPRMYHEVELPNGDKATRIALLRRILVDKYTTDVVELNTELKRRFGVESSIGVAYQAIRDYRMSRGEFTNKDVYWENGKPEKTNGVVRDEPNVMEINRLVNEDNVTMGVFELKSAVKRLGVQAARTIFNLLTEGEKS